MPRLTIDNQPVDVPAGATLLEAARQLGIDVPTLCFLEGYDPNHSCMVCMMKITQNGRSRLAASCATRAEEGMVVESESDEVAQVRKAALELLLSDHSGDCVAPCTLACPARMDIPLMLRQITADHLREAIVTIKRDIALPAVLGRICPAPCERGGCRRKGMGGPLAICHLKQHAADLDLATGKPYLPPRAAPTGKRVAVIGAGPAGLAGAFHLAQFGHAVTIFDEHDQPGGALRYALPAGKLPAEVLDREIGVIRAMGVQFRMNTKVGADLSLDQLRKQFDAVLVTAGSLNKDQADPLGLRQPGKGLTVDARTFASAQPGLFAAGAVIRPGRLAVRSLAEGHAAAESVHQFLSGQPVRGPRRPFTTRITDIMMTEMEQMAAVAAPQAPADRQDSPNGPWDLQAAMAEASRCLHCDCRKANSCDLRVYAERYGANPQRYEGQRRLVELRIQRGRVVFETGKCIKCGICVRICQAHAQPLGLAFIGRGFNVLPGVPFGESMQNGLGKVAELCVRHCPTGALSFVDEDL